MLKDSLVPASHGNSHFLSLQKRVIQVDGTVERPSSKNIMTAIYSDPGPSTSTNIPPIVRIAWATEEESKKQDTIESDPAPSSSRVSPIVRIAWASEPETEDPQKEDPLAEAWSEFQERVSVAGWQEVFGSERILWIRRIYQIVLIIFSIVCVYYVCQVVRDYVESGFVDEINDFPSEESMPMSNVSICAQIYFNETFVRQNLTIPDRVVEKMKDRRIEKDEFYRQLALYLTSILRPRPIDPFLRVLFRMVILHNPQIVDYTAFTDNAWLPCEAMLRRCWFGGVEFDCCRKATLSYDEDGMCYILAINTDSDNAQPMDGTLRQRTPGPSGGLTVEASVELKDFPWLEEDAQNGFRVLVAHTPYTSLLSPLGVPHNSETFVKVIAERRHLSSNCAKPGDTSGPVSKDLYHDPEGGSCIQQNTVDNVRKFAQCDLSIYLHRPNRSVVCSPMTTYIFTTMMTENDAIEKAAADFEAAAVGFKKDSANRLKESSARSGSVDKPNRILETIATGYKVKDILDSLTKATKSSFSEKARCPYHCQYWTYSSSASFVYLENRDPNVQERKRIYSKIHVYYGSLSFRQHSEVKASTLYLAFCDFGNVVGLYWGMSVISFFHVIYYVPKYLLVRRKLTHKVDAKRQSVS